MFFTKNKVVMTTFYKKLKVVMYFKYLFLFTILLGGMTYCSNQEKICACTKEYMPVIADGKQYNNFCLATCAGYDEDEIIIFNN